YIIDESANGTFVNGQPVSKESGQLLRNKNEISLAGAAPLIFQRAAGGGGKGGKGCTGTPRFYWGKRGTGSERGGLRGGGGGWCSTPAAPARGGPFGAGKTPAATWPRRS